MKISFYDWCIENEKKGLIQEWNINKNGSMTPHDVSFKSAKKIWWKGHCGHEWQAVVHSRTGGTGCPICNGKQVLVGFNDLSTTFPEISKEWHPTKNMSLKPEDVTRGFNRKKIWWKCVNGHEWEATVASRTFYNLGCPFCSGRYAIPGKTDLCTVNQELVKEWDYEKNGNLLPEHVKIGTHKKVWWKCCKGHSYQASIHSRTNMNSGCPICSKVLRISFPEKAIVYYLLKAGLEVVENYRPKWLGKSEIDIYIPNLCLGIEYDGQAWHKNGSKDMIKDLKCFENAVDLIRIREPECPQISGNGPCYTLPDTKEKSLNGAIKFILKILENNYKVNLSEICVDIEADRMKIYNLMEQFDKEKSVAFLDPKLAAEWNYEQNGMLMPEMVTRGSHKKVWWKCDKGHEWEAPIYSRAMGRGCPICAGQQVLAGENDLGTLYPDLASEWSYERNKRLCPGDVRPGTHQKVWWKCKNCEHEWEAEVKSRVAGRGCPKCGAERRRKEKAMPNVGKSLAECYPQIAAEWHPTKNGFVTAMNVHPGSHKKIWWKGPCGHEWEASIANRVNGIGCPYCSGRRILIGFNDLSTKKPEIAAQWDYKKNTNLEPNMVSCGSSKKVWWKCPVCRGNYQKSIAQKIQYPKCPFCKR